MFKPKVLITDDSEIDAKILKRILSLTYDTAIASSGQECLDVLDTFEPSIIILDINMPGLNGYETLSKIREKHPSELLPVIIVTEIGDTDSEVKALNTGANELIHKPVNRQVLLARLETQLYMSTQYKKLNTAINSVQHTCDEITKQLESERSSRHKLVNMLSETVLTKSELVQNNARMIARVSALRQQIHQLELQLNYQSNTEQSQSDVD